MSYQFQVSVDCAEPHRLAQWWAEVLGWQVEPRDEAFIRRMVEQGRATVADITTWRGELVWRAGAAIRHPENAAPRVLFQAVPEPKVAKNRVHLDLQIAADAADGDATAVEAEARLVVAGATVLHRGEQGPFRWVTMTDPEGNEFCLKA